MIIATILASVMAIQPLTPAEVKARLRAFDGEIVTVQGRISTCQSLDCRIEGGGGSLSIAGGTRWEPVLREALGRPVEIRGRIDARCSPPFPDGRVLICTDRVPELTPEHVGLLEDGRKQPCATSP